MPASDREPARPVGRRVRVLPLSARSDAALAALAGRYADLLETSPDLDLLRVAAAAGTTRSHLPQRLAVGVDSREAAIAALRAVAAGAAPPDPGAIAARTPDVTAGTTAFLFSGHGTHPAGAGHQLYSSEPVFRDAVDRCGDLLVGHLDVPLVDVMFGDGRLLTDMTYAQPALFALQYALTETWASWGVRPDVVAGHSAGEYAAAVAAGAVPLDDAVRLIATRGRLLAAVPGPGRMAALFTDEASVASALGGRTGDVGIAAVNGPSTTVVSGRPAAVEQLIAELGLEDDDVRWLDIPVAAHSPLVEPVLDDLAAAVATATLSRPTIGLVSSMTGRVVDAELTDPAYWRDHLRAPVRFADVVATMRGAGCRTFVEIGPGSTLLGLGRRNWPDGDAVWVPSMGSGDEITDLAAALADVYVAGAGIDWHAVAGGVGAGAPRVALPTYPWQRSVHSSPAVRRTARATSPLFDAAVGAATRQADQGPLDLRAERYPERWAAADRAAMAAVVRTLHDVGLFTRDGEAHTLGDLFSAERFDAGYRHLVSRWLDHLVEDGALERDGELISCPAALVAPDVDGAVDALMAVCGDIEPFARYVARCCDQLTAVVTGRESALETLFPGGSYETVEFNYGTWAVARYFNAIVRAAVEGALGARPDERIRILEIGAGTGGTSAAVLSALPPGRVEYTFTDVSSFFLARAAERFADHRFVTYAELDVEAPPEQQGFGPGSFDVVLAANVLHATRDLDRTLEHVRRLLAPGGVLVALENTTHPRFLDVTSGLMEGWELFEDSWRADVPLLDPVRWRAALASAGFGGVVTQPDDDAVTSSLLQHVLLARAPGEEERAVADDRTAAPAAIGSSMASSAVVGADLDAVALLADALPDERHDVLVGIVRRAVARVLRIGDDDQIGRDRPLLDLGFDSLMAVELRDLLGASLQLPRRLPATLVFDHPTVSAIAGHLDGLLRAAGDGEPSSEPAGPGAGPEPDAPVGADALAGMSDDEVAAMLMAKLAGAEGEA